jgi:predicted nucleic-acid-binding Zn-ribbon protein
MVKKEYWEALKCLENCDISEEKKIRFIENLNKLININFNNFIKNWHILN